MSKEKLTAEDVIEILNSVTTYSGKHDTGGVVHGIDFKKARDIAVSFLKEHSNQEAPSGEESKDEKLKRLVYELSSEIKPLSDESQAKDGEADVEEIYNPRFMLLHHSKVTKEALNKYGSDEGDVSIAKHRGFFDGAEWLFQQLKSTLTQDGLREAGEYAYRAIDVLDEDNKKGFGALWAAKAKLEKALE